MKMLSATEMKLKKEIEEVLKQQGFVIRENGFELPKSERDDLRRLHYFSRAERLTRHTRFINSKLELVKKHLINGQELEVENISPQLIEVDSKSCWNDLYRWWSYVWWSLPYEYSFGRQMRYIVYDKYHQSIIGLIGLQSPILSWQARDKYLNIKPDEKDYWVNQSLSAQRLGAIPPYNSILGGKLVSYLMTSSVIKNRFHTKYQNKKTEMRDRVLPANLLFITTTGAFGKSAVYSRLRYNDEKVSKFIGYSNGSGSFHIPNYLYNKLLTLLEENDVNIKRGYGSGPSRKMRLISNALSILGYKDGVDHHVKRGVYLFPLAKNLSKVIEQNQDPEFYNRSIHGLTKHWKKRWILPRIDKRIDYLSFNKDDFLNKSLAEIDELNEVFNEIKENHG